MTAKELLSILTPREQEIVRLRFGVGDQTHLTTQEVAAIFEANERTFRAELMVAVNKLRQRAKNTPAGILALRQIKIPSVGDID